MDMLSQFKSENSFIEYSNSSIRKWNVEYDISKRFIHVRY